MPIDVCELTGTQLDLFFLVTALDADLNLANSAFSGFLMTVYGDSGSTFWCTDKCHTQVSEQYPCGSLMSYSSSGNCTAMTGWSVARRLPQKCCDKAKPVHWISCRSNTFDIQQLQFCVEDSMFWAVYCLLLWSSVPGLGSIWSLCDKTLWDQFHVTFALNMSRQLTMHISWLSAASTWSLDHVSCGSIQQTASSEDLLPPWVHQRGGDAIMGANWATDREY